MVADNQDQDGGEGMELFLWICFYLWTFYGLLPALISRLFGFRVFLRGKADREIALTFDDGPDPVYTGRLLDLLRKYGARGTFFVVGENAERHPDLIARIHREGHVLGIHNYKHKTNWLMRPKTVKLHIQRTSDVVKRITGVRPQYYRPPWGIMNAFDYSKLGYLQVVLWTSMFGDWREKVGAELLYTRMRQKLKPGQVFLLHDCGSTFGADRNAPANMIAALERILQDGDGLSCRFVGIDEMIDLTERNKRSAGSLRPPARRAAAMSDGETRPARIESKEEAAARNPGFGKRLLVRIWLVYESLFHFVFRLRPVGDGKSINYRIRRYSGPPLDLRDDSTLYSGDYVMEMHFDNKMLYELGMGARSAMKVGIRIVRAVEQALPYLARELAVAKHGAEVKALYGISMIHRGSDSLGFGIHDLPRGLFAWMTNWYLRILIRVIHPAGNARVRDDGGSLVPKMLIMPRELLLGWADVSHGQRRPGKVPPKQTLN